jgi:hypothetical protein
VWTELAPDAVSVAARARLEQIVDAPPRAKASASTLSGLSKHLDSLKGH